MKQPFRAIMLGVALAFVIGLFLFLHHSTAESIAIAFEVSHDRASRAVSGLLSATLLVLMTHRVWHSTWNTTPKDDA